MSALAPRQSAQALVEFALIVPVMLIMLLGSLDIGRALVFGVGVQDGAREAARLGASATDKKSGITDIMVQQRLIDASSPALDGCVATAVWGLQPCGWTFTLDIGASHWTSIAAANLDPMFSGSELKVTARGDVSMWKGFSTPWGWTLFPIFAQGQAAMVAS